MRMLPILFPEILSLTAVFGYTAQICQKMYILRCQKYCDKASVEQNKQNRQADEGNSHIFDFIDSFFKNAACHHQCDQ